MKELLEAYEVSLLPHFSCLLPLLDQSVTGRAKSQFCLKKCFLILASHCNHLRRIKYNAYSLLISLRYGLKIKIVKSSPGILMYR